MKESKGNIKIGDWLIFTGAFLLSPAFSAIFKKANFCADTSAQEIKLNDWWL